MKITDLKVWVTAPEKNGRSFVYVQIDTDEGIHGIGAATSSGGGGSIVVGNMLRFLKDSTLEQDFRESLIGENPEHVDRIWHKLYRRFTGGGGSGGSPSVGAAGVGGGTAGVRGTCGTNATDKIGGGGGAANNVPGGKAGNGGSGIVMIRYKYQ